MYAALGAVDFILQATQMTVFPLCPALPELKSGGNGPA